MRFSRTISLAALAASLTVAGCSSLTSPPETERATSPSPAAERPAPAPGGDRPAPTPTPTAQAPQEERVGASHVLVAYKGAMRAAPTVTRSKDEARKRAQEVAKKARSGGDFTALAKEYSDD